MFLILIILSLNGALYASNGASEAINSYKEPIGIAIFNIGLYLYRKYLRHQAYYNKSLSDKKKENYLESLKTIEKVMVIVALFSIVYFTPKFYNFVINLSTRYISWGVVVIVLAYLLWAQARRTKREELSGRGLFSKNIDAYKVEYSIQVKPQIEALAKKLSEIDGERTSSEIEAFIISEREKYGLPPIKHDIFSGHNFSSYVNISSGLEIGYNHSAKTMGESYNHFVGLVYDNDNDSLIGGEDVVHSEFKIGLHSLEFRSGFKIHPICKYNLNRIEKLLVQIENSQMDLTSNTISTFPTFIQKRMDADGLRYTNNRDGVLDFEDYDYAYKDKGLKFDTRSCSWHTFENEYVEISIRVKIMDSGSFILDEMR